MAGITSVQGIELPSFRMKRSHKKSRSGCVSCKRRRVKCDETQPRCNRCTHRGLECVYGEQQPGRAPNSASPTDRRTHSNGAAGSPSTDNDSSPVTSPAVASSLDAIGITQTELAHHFLTHTSVGFASTSIREEQAEVWRSLIPSLAYTSSPVRHGMLVLSALSLHLEASPMEPSSKYLDAAEAYGDMFVKECGVQLKNLEPAKIDSAVACSRILSSCALAFFRIRRSNGLTLADSEAWTWLQLLRGVQTLHISIFDAGFQVHDVMARDMKPELPDATGAYSERPSGSYVNGYCSHPLFNIVQDSRQERFATLRAGVRANASEEDQAEVLMTSIDCLERVFDHICDGEMHSLFRAIVTWPGSFPQGYADILVNDLHPLALAIYAHWLVLVIMLENFWWVGDMGRSGILEIIATCSDTSPEIDQLLQWPRQVMEHLQENLL